MTYTLLLLVSRKPSLTFEAFKQHWETSHVPLLKKLVGSDFPLSHTRHYIEKTSAGEPNFVIGVSEGMVADGIATLTFIDRAHYERFMGKLHEPNNAKKHQDDLDMFADGAKLKGLLVNETASTGKDGGSMGWRFVGSI